MALISIILGILIDRHWDGLKQWQRFDWFSGFNQWLLEKTGSHLHNPSLKFLALLALPVLATMLVQQMADDWLTPFAFLFALLVFIYCLGSLDIEQTLESLIKAIADNDAVNRNALIEEITGESAADDETMIDNVMQASMDTIIERLFGIVFWFAILGPVGAVLYRFSQQLFAQYETDPVLGKTAERMLELLNWIPTRFLSISFGITGHFEGALAAYKENKETDRTQRFLLIDICHGALEGNEPDEKAAYLTAFRGLILRSLIVWISSIALLTLLGWS